LAYIHSREVNKANLGDTEHKMLWLCGGTGTGKSYAARTQYPKAYLKMCNKWWDEYNGQNVALIEDFDKHHTVLIHHMKIWADRYPFLAEVKGSAKRIRPRVIVVTSNYRPEDIWSDEGDLGPILRRFRVIQFTGEFAPIIPWSWTEPADPVDEAQEEEAPAQPPAEAASTQEFLNTLNEEESELAGWLDSQTSSQLSIGGFSWEQQTEFNM
jgi:hypothetical protein